MVCRMCCVWDNRSDEVKYVIVADIASCGPDRASLVFFVFCFTVYFCLSNFVAVVMV